MTKELERQVAALRQELMTVCAQYDDAIRELEQLRTDRDESARSEQTLREAHRRSEQQLRELVQREDRLRSAAEVWARDSQTLTDEMETASLVQRFMVDQAPFDDVEGLQLVSSYRPAAQTSGDWFGFDRDEDAVTVMVADATGHGLPASLLTAGVFASIETLRVVARMSRASMDLHMHVDSLRRPEVMLHLLHDVVSAMGGGLYGMTFVAARYEPRRRSLHVVNAAHPPPLWIRADATTNPVQVLQVAGSPLGLGTAKPTWGEQRVTISAGDLMLFYTDGLTEALDMRGRALGARRVAEWLLEARGRSLEGARDLLQSRFDDHVAGRVVHDDVTFVLLRFSR